MTHERNDFPFSDTVEGEILADRLTRGPLSMREGLGYAIQVGEILSAAHSRKRFHGGLSPSHVVLTESGARLLWPGRTGESRPGYTPAVQDNDREPDALADIFAFGALIFEIVTGHTPVDIEEQRTLVPAVLRETIANLMDQDPACRRQRMQNAVCELKLIRFSLPWPESRPPVASMFSSRRAAAGIALLILLAGCTVASVLSRQNLSRPASYKFVVTMPDQPTYIGAPAVSPDGTHVVFSSLGARKERMIWIRSLDQLRALPISGTEGGSEPFWSPDGLSIGFFASGSLRRVSVSGDHASAISPAEELAGGAAWGSDDTIVYAPGLFTGIYRVPAGGGAPDLLFAPDAAKGELAFRWPVLLPDGKHVLFFELTRDADTTGVYVSGTSGAERHMLFRSTTSAVYASIEGSAEYLLFLNGGNLVAQPIDPVRLTLKAEPVIVAADIGSYESLSLAPVSVSANGVLAYQNAGARARQLIWFARNGTQLGLLTDPGDYGPPRISPDGSKVAITTNGIADRRVIWIVSESRVEHVDNTMVTGGWLAWSADGLKLLFQDARHGLSTVDLAEGSVKYATTPLGFGIPDKQLTDWSRNGKYVLYDSADLDNRHHTWALALGAGKPQPMITPGSAGRGATFSPDGKYIAYQSEDPGGAEIYVQSFAGLRSDSSAGRRLSFGGGSAPRWSRDGSELYYLRPDGDLMTIDVRPAGTGLEFGAPKLLFRTRQPARTGNYFDVSPDGQRFIVSTPLEDATGSPVTIVTGWPGILGAPRMPTAIER